MRIGHGYDVHRLTEGRRLVLGGIEIPYQTGLLGHSDADVLVHAVIDAILGAAAMGDIGQMFPDSDARYKDADSCALLSIAYEKVVKAGFSVSSLDCTVIAQAPRLAQYIPAMRQKLCDILSLPENRMNIKATTEEKLGFTGAGLGIAAHAVVLLDE